MQSMINFEEKTFLHLMKYKIKQQGVLLKNNLIMKLLPKKKEIFSK